MAPITSKMVSLPLLARASSPPSPSSTPSTPSDPSPPSPSVVSSSSAAADAAIAANSHYVRGERGHPQGILNMEYLEERAAARKAAKKAEKAAKKAEKGVKKVEKTLKKRAAMMAEKLRPGWLFRKPVASDASDNEQAQQTGENPQGYYAYIAAASGVRAGPSNEGGNNGQKSPSDEGVKELLPTSRPPSPPLSSPPLPPPLPRLPRLRVLVDGSMMEHPSPSAAAAAANAPDYGVDFVVAPPGCHLLATSAQQPETPSGLGKAALSLLAGTK
ncbi:hypothetical protein N7462_008029 [Penicillium macrosclerotiorum]|uniref:uncharacterized protein n=1 Tax=Penicillium macrosclerotiorum TaxID=303699 RepID=UPI002546A304|nr:uncharacterized protein N7462_008029 [Penicillium macrosclerotiorum]KAJ5679785.1 hypothetical protein N7462_008029 [Penicillium macrosclerotiorum]